MISTHDNNLINHYLLATPNIQDPLFASSVVYLCEHNEEGSMGMVINHPSDKTLSSILTQLDIPCDIPEINDIPIYIGGPVRLEQGFVLHTSSEHWDHSILIGDGIYLTSSRDLLEAIAAANGPDQFMVLLGLSGWSAGQLDQELRENAWLTSSSSRQITFNEDIDQKWQMAFDTLGFSLDKLSPTTGHA